MFESNDNLGTAWMCPAVAHAGETGTWRLRFEVGAAGMRKGGGIRVQLPDSWHMGESNTAKPVHSSDPAASNFVSGRCSRLGASVLVEVENGTTEANKANRAGLDNRSGRYVYVVRVVTNGEDLASGDVIEVIYGERSGGSSGFSSARWAEGPEEMLVSVDATGGGTFEPLVENQPMIEVRSGEAHELVLTSPSSVVVGEEAILHLAVLDRYGNRCAEFEGDVSIEGPDSVRIDERVRFSPENAGIRRVRVRFGEEGVVRLRATAGDALAACSNPIACTVREPPLRLYWGELHAHGDRSFDAVGLSPFDYAHDVAALDVFALTDHSEGWPEGTWDWLRAEVQQRYTPGHFVTLLAYEASFKDPWGHHNVYFRGDDGVVLGEDRGTLLDLFAALEGHEALVVPHHTGVCWEGAEGNVSSGATPNVDWHYHDPRLRRLIEIYSGHGQSERYAPEHLLSYESVRYDLATSSLGPHYAWDAWGCGHVLGVVASSDNHQGQPGRGELGLTGIWAPELTREAIYDALHARQTYGTTGARILLDFSVDGTPMGGVTDAADGRLNMSIQAHGTGIIDSVELVVGDAATGRLGVAKRWSPGDEDFVVDFEHGGAPSRGLCYVRLRQREPYRGRVPMAWSSPVWIEPAQ